MAESDMQRSNGAPEAVRRQDGGGETSPLPGSEAARGSEQPDNKPAGIDHAAETWSAGAGGRGIRPASPADEAIAGTASADAPAQPDDDPQSGGGQMPQPASAEPRPATGADAPSHGSR